MARRYWQLLALVLCLALVGCAAEAVPGEPTPRPRSNLGLAAPGAGAAPPQAVRTVAPGLFATVQRVSERVLSVQAELNRQLASAVRAFTSTDPLSAAPLLVTLSFLYGVLHAAGPGHGKAIVSSYVLADGRTVRRGIALAFLAALVQALSALVLVMVLLLVLQATGLQVRATEAWLESASWGLVALVGAWLMYAQLRQLRRPEGAAEHHAHDAACVHHEHLPNPASLDAGWSWRRALALAGAIGVRPCSGAVLVLIFAVGQGIPWAGVFATLVMALGTAITVSFLAALTVGARELAVRLAGVGSSHWVARVRIAASLSGAGLVLFLGAVFFVASLGTDRPL